MTRKTKPKIYTLLATIVIVIFAGVGVFILVRSMAATPFLQAEPEVGTITAPASSVTDTTASGGKSVKFATAAPTGVNSTTPCVGSVAPVAWQHVVVLIFENKTYSEVIGSASAPWITGMSKKCGTYANWKDANLKVTGASDGSYNSKPSYATYTSGVPPSVHGMKNDTYTTTSSVDNIFNRLKNMGKNTKVYQSGSGGSCASSNFSGAYHDPMRYYTNLGGQSSSATTYCNTHDVPIANFMTDVNAGNLPAYSIILPTNGQNMHDNSVSSGDSWAKTFLVPFLDSARYKSGDTALFFVWDEDSPIPNVLMAPSIKPGTKPPTPTGNPISHYSALRTWQEMLGVTPLLGVTGQAPSLLNFYNGH